MNGEQFQNKLRALQQHLASIQVDPRTDANELQTQAQSIYDKMDELFGDKEEDA